MAARWRSSAGLRTRAPCGCVYPSPSDDGILWDQWPSIADRAGFEGRSALHLRRSDVWDTLLAHFIEGTHGHHCPRWSPDGQRAAPVEDGVVSVWSAADPEAGPEHLQPAGGGRVDDAFALWTSAGDALVVPSQGVL